jgi:NAD+ kinase
MATVALLAYPARDGTERLAIDAARWLESRGHSARLLLMGEAEKVSEDGVIRHLASVDLDGVDLAVSLGGDGTFLRLVPLAHAAHVPILGVNFGRLGYLLDVQPNDLLNALERTLSGGAVIEERTALSVAVRHGLVLKGEPSLGSDASGELRWIALNEMVIEKTVPGHMVHLATEIDNEPLLTYAADGIIVSTPTGSTAYNISAGGPVLAPQLHAVVVTPVAPHLAIDRSFVLHGDQVVTIRVLAERPAVFVIDGREVGRLEPGAQIDCTPAHRPVRFVILDDRGFARRLRETLTLDRER